MSGIAFDPELSDVLNDSYISTTIAVNTTEVHAKVGGSNLSKREVLVVYNKGPGPVYWGPTGVTAATGIPLDSGDMMALQFGDQINVFLISTVAGATVIVQEAA